MEKLFEDERDKVRELLRPIERVYLTIDAWTTTNNVTILGITIHWIDDMWKLHEQVLAVEELGVSHQGIILAQVVHHVLEEYDLTQKLVNMIFTFLIFNLKSINMIFFAITINNASNNKTMSVSLKNLFRESGSTFTKKFHVPCMAHVLNLAVQGGLKELGNSS